MFHSSIRAQVKEGPKAAVRTDDAIPHMHTWWLCRAGDNPCEAKGGHQQAAHIFRKLAFDQVDQHDWDLGANAHKKAQADLQILRYTTVWKSTSEPPRAEAPRRRRGTPEI